MRGRPRLPVQNPRNPFEEVHLEWGPGEVPLADLRVFEERCTRAVAENDSPDVGFRYSVNPYRGCFHACAYCYARPTHQYLGFGAGTDFDRRIVVKVNVAEQLRVELDRPGWRGELVALSGNTDCYQPLEARYRLTRACLEVLRDYRNPVGVITKGTLVRRDADLLAELAEVARCRVAVSIPFARDEDARLVEPYASSPRQRFETLSVLARAGVPVGVAVAPVIPGLNDHQIPEILERARDAGARSAFMVLVRLSREVLPVFEQRLEAAFPLRADKVRRAIREMRGGRMNDPRFGSRQRGQGARWAMVEQLFLAHRARLGMEHHDETDPGPTTFRRPTPQLSLF